MFSICAFSGAPSCVDFALNAELPIYESIRLACLVLRFFSLALPIRVKGRKRRLKMLLGVLDSRFFYAVFCSFSVATVVFEKEWSNHWERVRFPLPLRLQLQNSSLVDRSRLVVAVMWSRCEILARP